MEQVNGDCFVRSKTALRSLGRRIARLCGWGLFVFALSVPCRAADDSLEYQVKGAFLLNFVKFIEWPVSAFRDRNSPINICIWGDDPFGKELDKLVEGEVVNGRKVTVGRIKREPSPKLCQAVFLGRAEKADLGELGPGVLTVGEGEGFTQDGGMIGFVIQDRRVRFKIKQSAAEQAGLKLSSKLLSVAIKE